MTSQCVTCCPLSLTCRLSKSIVDAFGKLKNFTFAKFLNIRKYADCIRDIGMISLADTGHREAYIKFIRKCWDRTNKIARNIDLQVAIKVQELEAIEKAVEAATIFTKKGDKPAMGAVSMRMITPLTLHTHSKYTENVPRINMCAYRNREPQQCTTSTFGRLRLFHTLLAETTGSGYVGTLNVHKSRTCVRFCPYELS